MVRLLLQFRADMECSTKKAKHSRKARTEIVTSVLCAAAALGSVDIVGMLLDSGAAINNGMTTDGVLTGTPLSVACENGHTDVVRLLLDGRADVSSCSPAQAAGKNNHDGIVELVSGFHLDS